MGTCGKPCQRRTFCVSPWQKHSYRQRVCPLVILCAAPFLTSEDVLRDFTIPLRKSQWKDKHTVLSQWFLHIVTLNCWHLAAVPSLGVNWRGCQWLSLATLAAAKVTSAPPVVQTCALRLASSRWTDTYTWNSGLHRTVLLVRSMASLCKKFKTANVFSKLFFFNHL